MILEKKKRLSNTFYKIGSIDELEQTNKRILSNFMPFQNYFSNYLLTLKKIRF